MRCRVAGCFSFFSSEDELGDHTCRVRESAPLSDAVKKEEDYLPMEVEFAVPEMKQADKLVIMGQGAFKSFNPSSMTSSMPTNGKASDLVPAKRKPLSQSSLFQFFH